MDDEIKNFIRVWIAAIASLCYCHSIAAKIPRGIFRLFSLLPIIFLFICLPLTLSSFHLGAPTAFYLVWLATFKLLLFSFGLGPLSSQHLLHHPLHFISTALLPTKNKATPPPDAQNTKLGKNPFSEIGSKLPVLFLYAAKAVILAVIVRTYDYRENLHPYIILGLYCFHVYLGAELVLAITVVPVRVLLGLELEPQFNEPYLATSLQDFWGRRWNLVVTSILRPTVYDPVRGKWGRLLGTMATFLVSGVMHEVIYFYITRVRPTWEVTWFFVLQGICTVAEVAVKRAVVGSRWRLHRAVSGPLTVGFVAVTVVWLFLPQLIRNGVDRKAIKEYSVMVNFFGRGLQNSYSKEKVN